MTRHALLVAFHFPPVQASSGVHRTLAFARYLPDFGWTSKVLTVTPNAYERARDENYLLIPAGIEVVRVPALDTMRSLSIFGRYPTWLALPDRWQSWILTGLVWGLRAVRKRRPDVIFSTYPIASAHCVAYLLHRLTGIPWVADLRDPMQQVTWPEQPLYHSVFGMIERRVFRFAACVTVTTRGTSKFYREKYDGTPIAPIEVIPNGFDAQLTETSSEEPPLARRVAMSILHSGVVSRRDRDPVPLLRAISALLRSGSIESNDIRLVFRAPSNERELGEQIESLNLGAIVNVVPEVPYIQALEEMRRADALLVMQGESCNRQIPAKLYEYLSMRKPIIGLVDPRGDTRDLLDTVGIDMVADIADVDAISSLLLKLLNALRTGNYTLPDEAVVQRFSRKGGAEQLAEIFTRVAGSRSIAPPATVPR